MRNTMILILIAVFFSLTGVQAQGFYVGAGIGNSFIATEVNDLENQAKSLDENATGYKFFGGLDLMGFLAVEGGYRNLGTISISEYSFEAETKGWDVYAMGRIQIFDLVDLFAKAGYFSWKTESSLLGDLQGDETGRDFAWGVGAGVHLGPIGARLEWENFVVEDPLSISMISLSATYGF